MAAQPTQIVQQVLPAPVDPDVWETADRIRQVRPSLNHRWFRSRRDEKTLPFTKTGATSPCLYRLRDVDALLSALATPATNGPLAEVQS